MVAKKFLQSIFNHLHAFQQSQCNQSAEKDLLVVRVPANLGDRQGVIIQESGRIPCPNI